MKANNKKYLKARYDFDTNPQVYGFKVGETYQFRDFGRGVEVFYCDGCSLAMGYNMFNECFTKMRVDDPITENDIEYTSIDAFIKKAWDWIEDNLLSPNQQDKSRLYCEKFINYMKGE